MDIFESPYYRINKILLTSLGQWPLQKAHHKRLCRMGYACVVITITVPMILRLIEVWGNLDRTMECISILIIQAGTCCKLCHYVFEPDKIKKLMSCIGNYWKSDVYQPHMKVLKAYALQGKKLTQMYTVCMYSTLGTFVLMPVIPMFMDVMIPLNESRPLVYPIPVAYGNIDKEKYYIPIMLHADCAAFLAITTIVAVDTTYTVYVQHACGIFTALGDRLRNLMDSDEPEFADEYNTQKTEKVTYQAFVDCIKMHKEAIDFANAIESSHANEFFIVLGLSVVAMSLAGCQVIMNLNKPNEAFRFVIFTLSQMTHLLFITWPGQKLIDHSERIHALAYEAMWYETSPRSKQLVIFMMMRSTQPCKLTAGKLYDISFATLSAIFRTSMSYFTMLNSFR